MSEFSLIHNYFKHATLSHQQTIVGIGDDCAISHLPPNTQLVSCMDTLVAGRHFPINTTAYAIGYKSVAVNLSDLASMGAKPYAILLGLSLPEYQPHWLKEFSRGLAELCQLFHVELIGGDTTKSDTLTISITALGFVENHQFIQRNGAKVGDLICVSGDIGSASFALKHLLNNQPCELQSYLDMPMPQVSLGQKLVNYAHSMIDISDGLGQDLGHILTASGVGAKIDLEKIPCHQLLRDLPSHEKWQFILNGGDDYQLCCTLSQAQFEKFNLENPHLIYPIGEITHDQGLTLFHQGQKIDFEIHGWQHF